MKRHFDAMIQDPPSFLVAQFIVTELIRCGVKHFCICPGSRSTALALSVWRTSPCQHSVHNDERCAGFFALGKAMATGCPVALITTSGTAAAELLPAAVEAYQSQVPLILLTADRPAAVRGTGANQTIHQPGLFGVYAKAARDLEVLSAAELAQTQAHLGRDIAALVALSTDARPGPVHLNIQFDKPFEPAALEPYTVTVPAAGGDGDDVWFPEDLETAAACLAQAERGLIIVGPNRYPPAFAAALLHLARRTGFPILADPLSGLRQADARGQFVIAGYEAMFQAALLDDVPCDLILRFGSLPVSLQLIRYWTTHLEPDCPHLYVNASRQIHDETGAVTHYLSSSPLALCERLTARLPSSPPATDWLRRWRARDDRVAAALSTVRRTAPAWDGAYVARLLASLPASCILFAGNSLPVRLVDLAGRSSWLRCRVFGNRGASGIDGQVSTALGIAHSTEDPVCLLLGDLSLLHDIGGLAAVRHLAVRNLVVVVLNNQGGGIFERLPVARLRPAAEELFIARHEISCSRLADAFGLQYQRADSPAHLADLATQAFSRSQAHLLEVVTDRRQDLEQAQQLTQLTAKR